MAERTPLFSRQISVGNIIQIAVVIVGISTAWFAMDYRSQGNSQAILGISIDLVQLQKDIKSYQIELRELEKDQIRADERYSNMLTLLARIDSRLERIEAAQ
jgi:hypothetical protein